MEKWREDVELEIALDFAKWLNKPELAPIFAQSDESKETTRNWLKNNRRQVEQKCENCKHWGKNGGDTIKNGFCYKFKFYSNGITFFDPPKNNSPFTKPDFGCTLFERKGGE